MFSLKWTRWHYVRRSSDNLYRNANIGSQGRFFSIAIWSLFLNRYLLVKLLATKRQYLNMRFFFKNICQYWAHLEFQCNCQISKIIHTFPRKIITKKSKFGKFILLIFNTNQNINFVWRENMLISSIWWEWVLNLYIKRNSLCANQFFIPVKIGQREGKQVRLFTLNRYRMFLFWFVQSKLETISKNKRTALITLMILTYRVFQGKIY